MIRILAILLVFSLSAFGDPFRFEPLPPTSQSFIHLRVESSWRDSCVPSNARVSRNGTNIEVLWTVPRGVACLAAITRWTDRVPIGVLEPGVYTVTLKVDDVFGGVKTIATETLIVADGAPAFRIAPLYASTRGGSEVVLTPLNKPCDIGNVQVAIDGTPVAATVSGCAIRVSSLPAHPAGPVDITLTDESGTTSTLKATLRYLDPAAAPDPDIFERILIPVLYSGPGAYGSQWVTEGELINLAAEPLQWFSDVARPCSTCSSIAPAGVMSLSSFGNRSNGVIVFLPRAIADRVQFGVISRETSRGGSWGTEVPIARERDFDRPTQLHMPNVPVDPRLRTMLRIYGIDGVSQIAGVAIRKGGTWIASKVVALNGPCDATPCNSAEPAYASVDIGSMIPPGTVGPVAVILYEASSTPARLWGFVSITDNETQHVTVIRPQ